MVDHMAVKLVDFNTAKKIDSGLKRAKTYTGTKFYFAPEIDESEKGYDGLAADIWSAGILMYKMMTGRFPEK